MSTLSNANTAYLDRTTGFANADPTTIALWFRLASVSGTHTIWDHGDNTAFAPQLWASGNQLTLTPTSLDNESIATVAANTWYFVACVFNGTASPVTYYVGNNGAALTTSVTGSNFGGWTGTVLTLYNELAHDQTMNGRVVGFKVWNGTGGALSADQIANEYKKLAPSTTQALYSALPLLNATAPGTDLSGNARDFTVHGALSTQREMPPIPWLGEP